MKANTKKFRMSILMIFSLILFLLGFTIPGFGQNGDKKGDWAYWGSDAGSSRYSSLDQINGENAEDLEVAWRWNSANFGPQPEYYYRTTPIAIDGILYAVAGERRAVVAIDGATGETIWIWRMKQTPRWEVSPRRFSGRGVAYAEVEGEGRIFVITPGFFLASLDARTGRPDKGFGKNGIVDLMVGLGYDVDPETGIDPKYGLITAGSPPIVVNGVIVVNNAHGRGYYPSQKENIPGHIRGYDVQTGKQKWIFHVIPKPGEFGHDTWEGDSWTYTGNVSSWPPLSADPELGMVYIPTDTPTGDYYGGHRHGDNLYGTSVIALDVATGKRVWHQQLVKHDIWNYDNPTAPNLVDITVDGRRIKAIVQATKQGWAYVFDRETGEPVWPMEERKVAKSDVPGEKTSSTQRFPTWPKPYELQGITIDDLIDFTPELRAEAIEIVSKHRMGPIFTPPSLAKDASGTLGTLVVPGANGGTNISGGAVVDPETGILYVATVRGHSNISMVHDPKKSNMRYISLGPGGIRGPRGLPLLKPPYGRIVAIDLNTGEHIWEITNGDTPAAVKNHKALQGIKIPRTGKNRHANVLVTKTALFAGEGRGGDPWFRVINKKTGKILTEIELPASTNAAPMTYMANGKQYIVVAIAGPDFPAELFALALVE
ncbi:PQQ-binding-like beta-propeller repeat protein [candidate division KSB1 bacterium]|nr:PQQ-binding-like beta-propeller repeat protein [candidate division KSB1 bacterium]